MKDNHFSLTFWFVAGTTFFVLLYIPAITFFPIPKENQRFVDIALAFLLGYISSNASYLTGGNPNASKKPSSPEGTTTANISAEIITDNTTHESSKES